MNLLFRSRNGSQIFKHRAVYFRVKSISKLWGKKQIPIKEIRKSKKCTSSTVNVVKAKSSQVLL